ncbi:hypothetical protein RMCBS344292_09432 [Rhizopus microsporus]|nr:hypothetical protein RMCBS344292_09432 [Rhizopus microsporus]
MYSHINDQLSIQDIEYENAYFNDYDQEMVEAVNEADYNDQQKEQEDQEQDDEYIIDERLLKLIVDVQSYLSEVPAADSPLLALQYKMYTYLKQRAMEIEMENNQDFTAL